MDDTTEVPVDDENFHISPAMTGEAVNLHKPTWTGLPGASWLGEDGWHYDAVLYEDEERGDLYWRIRRQDREGVDREVRLYSEHKIDLLRLIANGYTVPTEAELRLQAHRKLMVRSIAAENTEGTPEVGDRVNKYQAAMLRSLLDQGVDEDKLYAALIAADNALGRELFA